QDHVGVDDEAHVEAARSRVAEALGADHRVVVVAALAAVLLGEAEAEEAQLARPGDHLAGPGRLLPLVAVGEELLFHPRLHRLALVFVLLREDHVLALGAVVRPDDLRAVGSRGCHWDSPLVRSRSGQRRRPAVAVDSSTSYFPQSRLMSPAWNSTTS